MSLFKTNNKEPKKIAPGYLDFVNLDLTIFSGYILILLYERVIYWLIFNGDIQLRYPPLYLIINFIFVIILPSIFGLYLFIFMCIYAARFRNFWRGLIFFISLQYSSVVGVIGFVYFFLSFFDRQTANNPLIEFLFLSAFVVPPLVYYLSAWKLRMKLLKQNKMSFDTNS